MKTGLLFVAAFFVCISGAAHSETVGAYICGVDNCNKSYLEHGDALVDACRVGVGNASDSQPSSPACLSMCDTNYSGKGERGACKKGCALFPDQCLRDGKIAPKEEAYDRDRGDQKWKPTPQRMPQPRRQRDRYRYWY